MISGKKTTVFLLCLFIPFLFLLPFQIDTEARILGIEVAEKLRRTEARLSGLSPSKPMSLVFSEKELNAFIAYDLEAAQEKNVKKVVLKLMEQNRIEGKILIELGGGERDSLPSRFELFFSAGFETEAGKIRIDMDSLFLGTQKLPVVFIDTVIAVVSRIQGVEPTSLRDWYELPYSIQRLETLTGRLIVRY